MTDRDDEGQNLAPLPVWRPEFFALRKPRLVLRQRIKAALRALFEEQGLQEVETPALQISPGLEPNLTAFATEIQSPADRQSHPLFLHTSPEFAMKKLLVAGAGPIFQFARVFRNAERSSTHHPEFTMLEWYRPGETYQVLMEDCARVLSTTLKVAGRSDFSWAGKTCAPGPIEILSMVELFACYAKIDLPACLPNDELGRTRLAEAARRLDIHYSTDDDWDDLFFRIFLSRIEPHLGIGRPHIVTDYPVHMAALARVNPEDPRFAERFELYVCGLELANAFGELTDAEEQARRFGEDQSLREKKQGIAYPVDEDFLAALQYGLPLSSGIALGFDRLVMLASGAERIEEVLWLPVAGS